MSKGGSKMGIDTKYGDVPSSAFENYRKSIVDRIWLLIPLKEEGCQTIPSYIERLNRELCGMMKFAVSKNEYIMTVISLLENLRTETDFATYRHDVLRCCELIAKVCGGASDVR